MGIVEPSGYSVRRRFDLTSGKYSPFRKPSPGMLEYILNTHDVKPETTLFVGDKQTDKDAARAAGIRFVWNTVWYETGGQILKEYKDKSSNT